MATHAATVAVGTWPGVAGRVGTWLAGLSGWRAGLAAALFGVLAAAALPPVFALPTLLVAVPGLLVLIDGARGWRGAAVIGFWFGFGHHVVGLYWITEAILFEAARFWWLVPLAVPALAAVLAAFIAVAAALARTVPAGPARVLTLAGAWVLADLARQFVGTGFPWNPWGSVWALPGAAGDAMLQPAAWVGVQGLTLATVLLAATPALGRRAMLLGAAALVAWAGFGAARLTGPTPPAPGLHLVLVQGNVPQGRKWDRAFVGEFFRRYLTLTHEGVTRAGAGPTVVIWPETASPYLLAVDAAARAVIADAARGPDGPAAALIGSVRFDTAGRPRNSLMAIDGSGPPLAVYDKWHLVPFGEYQPGWMPLPIQVVSGGGFAAGAGPRPLHVHRRPAGGPLICYESIFGGEIVDAADRPVWLVLVTNDAWFGNSTGPRQHLVAARLRAVEEGLPLARAANTGITAVFDAYGREIGRIGMNRSGVLLADLPAALPATPFARFGLTIPAVLAGATLAAGVALGRRVYINTTIKSQ